MTLGKIARIAFFVSIAVLLFAFILLAAMASFQAFATEEHKFGPDADQYCPKLSPKQWDCDRTSQRT